MSRPGDPPPWSNPDAGAYPAAEPDAYGADSLLGDPQDPYADSGLEWEAYTPPMPGYPGYGGDSGYPGVGTGPDPAPSSPTRPRRRIPVWGWVAGAGVAVAAVVVAVVLIPGSSPASPTAQAPATLPVVGLPSGVPTGAASSAGVVPGTGAAVPGGGASGPATTGRSVRLPAAFDGYKRVTGLPDAVLRQELGTELAAVAGTTPAGAVEHARIGAYSRDGINPQIIVVALDLNDMPTVRQDILAQGPAPALSTFLTGTSAGSHPGTPQTFPPGPLGGAQQCVLGEKQAAPVATCGWADQSYLTLTLIDRPGAITSAAALTRDLREAAEK